jgi:hypothetical protein
MVPQDHKAHVGHKEFLALLVQLEPLAPAQPVQLDQQVPVAPLGQTVPLVYRALPGRQLLLLDQCQM